MDQWQCASLHTFDLGSDRKIVGCFPLVTGKIIFVRHSPNCLIVGFSENPPEWQQIARIDCIQSVETVFACQSPTSKPQCCIIIIGTQDGHVYQLQMNSRNLTLLCDIQQPVTSVLNINNQLVILGKYGKIVRLDGSTKEALTYFAPTAISCCYHSGQKLYLLGSEQLYSVEMKHSSDGGSFGEANFSKVKFVRAFYLKDNCVFILTENGTIYQSSLVFGSQEEQLPRSGAEIKPILLEIHRCTDRTKAMNAVSERVRLDVAQLSIALHMLNQDVGIHFPIIVKSFADPIYPQNQRLNITITNKSTWDLSPSHWAFQISVRRTDNSHILLRKEWKMGKELELEHHFELLDDAFDVELKMSLAFRVIDSRKESESQHLICFFPLSTVELSVLNFLEPSSSDMFEFKNNITDVIGFNRKNADVCPWPVLLQRSWHRGFAQWMSDPPPMQIVLRCGSHPVRLTLKEDENPSDKIWILRIETSNSNLLRLLRICIFRQIESQNPPSKAEAIIIPSHVLAHLQVGLFYSNLINEMLHR